MYQGDIRKGPGRIGTLLLWSCKLLLFCSNAKAQIPGMRKYTQLDGYTVTKGYDIEQDEKGYIWLATDNGGMNFDGKTFRIARNALQSPDAEILHCRPLGKGRVLLLPLSHTPSYYERGKVVTDREDPALRAMKMTFNYSSLDPVTGKWWLSDQSRLGTLFSFGGKDIHKYTVNIDSFDYCQVINNKFIGQKEIAPGNFRLCLYDRNRGTIAYFRDTAGNRKKDGTELFVRAGPNRDYLVTRVAPRQIRIYRYNDTNNSLVLVRDIHTLCPVEPSATNSILLDPNHQLWVKSDRGIFFYGDITGSSSHLSPYYFPQPELVNSILIDGHNNLWISSPNNALYFLSEKHLKNELSASRFPHREWSPQAIAGDGTGTICISYTNHDEITCISGSGKKEWIMGGSFPEGSRHILPLNDGRFALYNRDIALLDPRESAPVLLGQPSTYKDLCRVGDSAFIAATAEGVFYFTSVSRLKWRRERLLGRRSTTVAVLQDKRILIGTPEGLYIKKGLNAPAVKVKHPVLDQSNITEILVRDSEGAFVGTNARGLFMIGHAEARPITFAGSDHLGHVRRLYKQNDSIFWVATDNGAYALVFDRNWSVIANRNYTFYDGLPSNNVTDIYVHHDTAYFSTTQGLGIIPLKDTAHLQMLPPRIFINTVQSGDTVFYEPDSAVRLSYRQRDLLISLSAISYESLGNTSYYYQLSPIQDKWIQTTNPEIRFTELPPGNYRFKAYAVNAKNVLSSSPVVLSIGIRPAFWQTPYFIIAVSLLTCVLLYLCLRWTMRRGEKKRLEVIQQKKRLTELELEAIKAQVNPHFIHNCLNSIKYLNYTGEYKASQEYLGLFAKLIRMTMQYSRKTFITLEEEVDYLSSYLQLEKLRFKDRLEYTIAIERDCNKQVLLPAMLLQPYIENALKHGIGSRKAGGSILIAFREWEGQLEILVKDDGPGFSAAEASDALGMYLSGTRAVAYNELFNLDIKVQYYNEQDHMPGKTGAVVKITLNTITDGPLIQ